MMIILMMKMIMMIITINYHQLVFQKLPLTRKTILEFFEACNATSKHQWFSTFIINIIITIIIIIITMIIFIIIAIIITIIIITIIIFIIIAIIIIITIIINMIIFITIIIIITIIIFIITITIIITMIIIIIITMIIFSVSSSGEGGATYDLSRHKGNARYSSYKYMRRLCGESTHDVTVYMVFHLLLISSFRD